MVPELERVPLSESEAVLLKDAIDRLLEKWKQDSRVSDGILLEDVELSFGDNEVNHLLDRELAGWSVVKQDAASSIYDLQESNDTPDKTLILSASVPCTVSLWVF